MHSGTTRYIPERSLISLVQASQVNRTDHLCQRRLGRTALLSSVMYLYLGVLQVSLTCCRARIQPVFQMALTPPDSYLCW